eukprot:9035059-Lingulodinium_polyedra.AAC.1
MPCAARVVPCCHWPACPTGPRANTTAGYFAIAVSNMEMERRLAMVTKEFVKMALTLACWTSWFESTNPAAHFQSDS